MVAQIVRRKNRVVEATVPRHRRSKCRRAREESSSAEPVEIDARSRLAGQFAGLCFAAAARFVAAGLDCAGAVVAVGSTARTERPAALSRTVDCRLCAVAGGDPLAAVAALDDIFRLAGAGVLFGVLCPGVRRVIADCRASIGHLDRVSGAGCLHRLGVGARAFAQRIHDGEPGSHANSLAATHSSGRCRRLLRHQRADHVGGRLRRAGDSLGRSKNCVLADSAAGGSRVGGILVRPMANGGAIHSAWTDGGADSRVDRC